MYQWGRFVRRRLCTSGGGWLDEDGEKLGGGRLEEDCVPVTHTHSHGMYKMVKILQV